MFLAEVALRLFLEQGYVATTVGRRVHRGYPEQSPPRTQAPAGRWCVDVKVT
jgi:hypothetical protein